MPAPSASPAAPRVLIVDDDEGIRSLLLDYLSSNGFAPQACPGAASARELAAREPFDLFIVDLMMPGEDGLSLARWLSSAAPGSPILMASARGEDLDRIIGLEAGCDDYLPKPFNPRELLARAKALLRRRSACAPGAAPAASAPPAAPSERRFPFGRFLFLPDSLRLLRDGSDVEITSGERDLLLALATRPNRSIPREDLARALRGFDPDPLDRSIDTRVARLRKKIEEDPANPRHIRTVWGRGYLFCPNPDAAAPPSGAS